MTIMDKEQLLKKIDVALDEIRPHLAVDGGDIEVVEVTDEMTLKVRWLGNCEYCTMSTMTMKAGVQEAIKQRVPEVLNVEAINGTVA